MPKIVTVTFSPCIDKSTTVPALVPEKKLLCTAPKMEPGGGGINVARAIIRLGGEATAVYPAGGYAGKYFNELLGRQQVPAVCIETAHETRENLVVLDELTNLQYRLGMPGAPLQETEWRKVLQVIEDMTDVEFIVASGSLPPGVPVNIYGRMAVIAKQKGAKLVVDTSGDALKHAASEGLYLLKPNVAELGSLVGRNLVRLHEIRSAAKTVIARHYCKVIVVSMGKAGAMAVTEDIEKKVAAPKIKSKSSVGAGDSMVAGLVWSLSKGNDLETAVEYGVACGSASVMNPGTALCEPGQAEKLFRKIQQEAQHPAAIAYHDEDQVP